MSSNNGYYCINETVINIKLKEERGYIDRHSKYTSTDIRIFLVTPQDERICGIYRTLLSVIIFLA